LMTLSTASTSRSLCRLSCRMYQRAYIVQISLRSTTTIWITFRFGSQHFTRQIKCHLLALLGAHPILHVGRIRVNTILRSLLKKPSKSDTICYST
jgi:hypothetical protein